MASSSSSKTRVPAPRVEWRPENLLYVTLVFLVCASLSTLALAQYSGGAGGYSYGGDQATAGPEEFEGPEDRPKVRLGIRLRIPAFKFELPRFSLPKITVSAKIRQPDGPRVIRLPEINFDTSSKVEPPGQMGGGGGGGYSGRYQTSPSYSMASYGGAAEDQGKSNTFTFSTNQDTEHQQSQPLQGYGPRYNHANHNWQALL